jgi:hypothetical protein
VKPPESEVSWCRLVVTGAVEIEVLGVTVTFLVDGGEGRGRARIIGCPRWRAVSAEGFDVPGALRVGPTTRSVGYWLEELIRCRGWKRPAGAGFGVTLVCDAARLPDSEASCAVRRRLVDTCSEFCFWRDRCVTREKRSAVSERAIIFAVVAFLRCLRAAATVCLSSGVGGPGNERCGFSEADAAEPGVRSG